MRIACLLLVAAAAPAQSVLHVPGTFQQIHQALAVAQPGDVVEVATGTYAPFAVTSGVTIRGTGSAPPSVFGGGAVTFLVPAGQQAYVFHLNLYSGARVLGGSAAFERCRLEAPQVALDVDAGGEAVLAQSTVLGGVGQRDGARVRGRISAVNCVFEGAPSWVTVGGTAVVVDGGSVQLARCQLNGGGAVLPAFPATDALVVQAGHAWLADCTVRGGTSQVSGGGNGIHNLTATPVHTARTICTGGGGTPPGTATIGPLDQNAPLLGIQPLTNGLARGHAAAVHPQGPPGMPVLAFFALRAAVVLHPALAAPAWTGGGADAFAFGVLDATGDAAFPIVVPNQPWLADVRLFFEVFGIDAQGVVQPAPPHACLVQ